MTFLPGYAAAVTRWVMAEVLPRFYAVHIENPPADFTPEQQSGFGAFVMKDRHRWGPVYEKLVAAEIGLQANSEFIPPRLEIMEVLAEQLLSQMLTRTLSLRLHEPKCPLHVGVVMIKPYRRPQFYRVWGAEVFYIDRRLPPMGDAADVPDNKLDQHIALRILSHLYPLGPDLAVAFLKPLAAELASARAERARISQALVTPATINEWALEVAELSEWIITQTNQPL